MIFRSFENGIQSTILNLFGFDNVLRGADTQNIVKMFELLIKRHEYAVKYYRKTKTSSINIFEIEFSDHKGENFLWDATI